MAYPGQDAVFRHALVVLIVIFFETMNDVVPQTTDNIISDRDIQLTNCL